MAALPFSHTIATLDYARPQGAGDFLDRTRTTPGPVSLGSVGAAHARGPRPRLWPALSAAAALVATLGRALPPRGAAHAQQDRRLYRRHPRRDRTTGWKPRFPLALSGMSLIFLRHSRPDLPEGPLLRRDRPPPRPDDRTRRRPASPPRSPTSPSIVTSPLSTAPAPLPKPSPPTPKSSRSPSIQDLAEMNFSTWEMTPWDDIPRARRSTPGPTTFSTPARLSGETVAELANPRHPRPEPNRAPARPSGSATPVPTAPRSPTLDHPGPLDRKASPLPTGPALPCFILSENTRKLPPFQAAPQRHS